MSPRSGRQRSTANTDYFRDTIAPDAVSQAGFAGRRIGLSTRVGSLIATFLQNDLVLGLAFRDRVHRGSASQRSFRRAKLYWRVADFSRDAGKFSLALRIGVDAHIQLVCTDKP